MKLLLVEDETRLAQSIKSGLVDEGYIVDIAHDGQLGYDLASSKDYDLIILDLMLPLQDGLTVCKKLRQEKNKTPIIMLTAKSSLDDKVLGLNLGADDYLSKPFDFEELLARINALLRRPSMIEDTFSSQPNMNLSQKENQILDYLSKNSNRWISKEELIRRVWSYDTNVLENTVEVTIKNIRNKISKNIIKTRRGFGYQYQKNV